MLEFEKLLSTSRQRQWGKVNSSRRLVLLANWKLESEFRRLLAREGLAASVGSYSVAAYDVYAPAGEPRGRSWARARQRGLQWGLGEDVIAVH